MSDDGTRWRRIAGAAAPIRRTNGLAFARDGSLLIANEKRDRVWRLRPGGHVLRPLDHGPRAFHVQSSGGAIVAYTSDRHSIDWSRDGRHWTEVNPLSADMHPVR